MNRRGIPEQKSWYLKEWMDHLSIRQAEMMRRTGWSKASTSYLYNGVQDFSPKLILDAAKALEIEPYELLIPPATAMALRGLRESARQIAATRI